MRIFFLSDPLNNDAMQTIEEIYRLRLRMLADELGSQRKLADKLQRSPSQVNQWINGAKDSKTGKSRSLDRSTARYIEQMTGKPEGWMDQPLEQTSASNVSPASIGMTPVPLINYIQAGNWREVVDAFQPGDGHEIVYTDQQVSGNTFALHIRGDSMYRPDSPDSFSEGDLVIIDPNVQPRPGEYVAAKNGNQEATFKKYRQRGLNAQGVEYFELVPLNTDYETMRSDLQHITIIGTMIEHRKFRRK